MNNQTKVASKNQNKSASTTMQRQNVMIAIALAICASLPLRCSENVWPVALASLAAAAAVVLGALATRSAPSSPLMELAETLRGAPPPAALAARAATLRARKAAARPPRTPDAELARLVELETPRFEPDDASLLAHLDEHGFAVVARVADDAALDRARGLLWDFLEEHTGGWQRGDEATWTDEGMEAIGSAQNGIVNGRGIGQAALAWHARCLPRARRAFETVWGTRRLIASFDGANVFRPIQRGFRRTVGGWWHVDQGGAKVGRHAVQGLLALTPQDASTGGLCVVPGSHRAHAAVCAEQGAEHSHVDYVTIQPYWPGWEEFGAPARVVCRAGDLILWDSRTVHCNAPATRPPPEDHGRGELLRAAVYVCLVPRRFAPWRVLRQRVAGHRARVTTSHWPQQYQPGSLGLDDEPPLPEPTDPVQRSLIGYWW